MLKKLFKTTIKEEADRFEKEAISAYGLWSIYRFQYRAIDGKFYYEILLSEDD